MQLRPLGRSGLQVSPLAFGGNVFGWTADEAHLVLACSMPGVDAGFNFVDTADVYSRWVPGHTGGESETIIGNWLQAERQARQRRARHQGRQGHGRRQGRPVADATSAQAVEASLRRLQTDHIDLYQSHDDDADTPLEETLEAFAELIKEGKVRAIGASNYSAPRLAEALDDQPSALGLPRYESLQPLYNLYDRAVFEDELRAAVPSSEGVGVINFYALARGFLTGKYRSPKPTRQERARRQHVEEVPERARPAHPGRARRGVAARRRARRRRSRSRG